MPLPIVAQSMELQRRAKITDRQIAKRAGIAERLPSLWRLSKVTPTVPSLEAYLGALGYKLAIVRKQVIVELEDERLRRAEETLAQIQAILNESKKP